MAIFHDENYILKEEQFLTAVFRLWEPTEYFYFNLLISRKRKKKSFYPSSSNPLKDEDEVFIILKLPLASGESDTI